jgi:predicted nucleic acid-binding protein
VSDPFFDTNILIDWLRDLDPAIAELRSHPRHRISRVVWTEVLAGEPPSTRDHVRDLLVAFDLVEVDQRIALAAADIRHSTRMKLLDAIILATARVNGAMLVTRNTKDFPADMPGVRVPYTL